MKSFLPTFSTGNIRPTSYFRTPTRNVRPKDTVNEATKKVVKPLAQPKIGPVVPVSVPEVVSEVPVTEVPVPEVPVPEVVSEVPVSVLEVVSE